MGTERKPRLKLNVKKLIREQKGGACMDDFLALTACMEKVCTLQPVVTHTYHFHILIAQNETRELEVCHRELEAYEQCVKINHAPNQNRPKINYTLMRLGNYFKPFKGFFVKVK